MGYTQNIDSTTFLKLIKERGPLTIWEMSMIVETDVFRVEEKLDPIIKEGFIVPFEGLGRTYYKIPGEDSSKKTKSFFFLNDLFKSKLKFEPIPERTTTKHILASKNNYKKLIQEAYVLTLPPNPYTEEERIKLNLWVERDLKKLSTLDEKRLFLADFIYEKSVGKDKNYFKKRKLIEES